MNSTYGQLFQRLSGLPLTAEPHSWQVTLAGSPECTNRLIKIPTGFGKTFGVLAAWLQNRVVLGNQAWPRRLVWCLPMRVLVEQVAAEVQAAFERVGGDVANIGVHTLMGGIENRDWHISPEREAVLIGTQDMLLSRAMNRGYGSARARWPMEFGLLNHDSLWVMDEVQLMDVGLATSAQLQAFRDDDLRKALRPCKTWWMSATLQRDWLARSPDTKTLVTDLPSVTSVPADMRHGLLWEGVRKPVRLLELSDIKKFAGEVVEQHRLQGYGRQGPTLVVVNRVARAVDIYEAIHKLLDKNKELNDTELRLVHSRFRPADRAGWRTEFLNRKACAPGTNRIIVSTQVVEAGVDMSAALLFTDLAPWSSLVQRFGRAARWGGEAPVVVVDTQPKDDKAAAPYAKDELDAARRALLLVGGVAPIMLEQFEEQHPELLAELYPYQPRHILLRQDIDDLFDTAPDLSGTDIDISRFIRSGDERDVLVFWREIPLKELPTSVIHAARDELCAVPFLAARDWLCANGHLKHGVRAWVWDWLDGSWHKAEMRDMFPGRIILVASEVGGYDRVRGWDPKSIAAVDPCSVAAPSPAEIADDCESDETLSAISQWQTIAFHGQQVGRVARSLAQALVPKHADLFDLAGRWHDAGKAHPAFQGSLQDHGHGQEIAKAPTAYWRQGNGLYRMPDGSRRAGFRHELASTLALIALLQRCHPDHPALLGPWRDLLSRTGQASQLPPLVASPVPNSLTPLEREIMALDVESFDLLLYLVCTHHGKVRVSWQSSPADQQSNDDVLRIRGVRSGDLLPQLDLMTANGTKHRLPSLEMRLAPASVGLNVDTGRGWTERVLGLLEQHGPFALAWLEALMRAADQRASRDSVLVDPALQVDDAVNSLIARKA